jgi:hypothetical protein
MSILLLIAVLGADEANVSPKADPPGAVAAKDAPAKALPQRTQGEIRIELSDLLAAERSADTIEKRQAIILQMTRLYCELASDPRIPDNETLNKNRFKLRARLIDLRDEFKRRVASQKKKSKKEAVSTGTASTGAQGTGQGASGQGGGGGGAAAADNAAQLIEVIETTIAPESWDTNGGPGAIRYYAAVHALVVRATAETHGELSGLVDGLREVSR